MIRTPNMALLLAIIFATVATSGHAELPASDAPDTTELTRQRDRLQLENSLREEKLREELASQTAELARLKSEADLQRARIESELAEKRLAIEAAKVEVDVLNSRAAIEQAKKNAERQVHLLELRATKERAELEAELATAEFTKRASAFKMSELEWNGKAAEMRAKLAEREKEQEMDAYADQRPVYQGSADPGWRAGAERPAHRAERADHDEHGGLRQLAHRLLQQQEQGVADLHRDRRFAGWFGDGGLQDSQVDGEQHGASLCRGEVVCREHGGGDRDAVEALLCLSECGHLHHQISSGTMGNLTDHRENLQTLEQWWRRLASPIAAKMGITTEEFVAQMYAHTKSGDWKEFADEAVKLKWVDHVLGRCRETVWCKNPDSDASTAQAAVATLKTDPKGRSYVAVPRLNPVDCYYLHNPDGYYRVE